jgi:hypothetical protein
MREKLITGLVAAAVIAPLCAVCVLGPALIASIFTGIAAWLGGFDAVVTTGLVFVAGIAVFAVARRRRAQRGAAKPTGVMSQ